MADDDQPKQCRRSRTGGASAGPVYFLGGIGAAVYFFHQVTTFWGGVLAILKAFVWPALLVYQAMHALHM
ncbi:MAG TPA: hypothetical protein VFT53_00080 [Candidatus Saccharimonadales bacterium]|nr:hypothetical protein [Candidatus Saccharimonadales bacterium]